MHTPQHNPSGYDNSSVSNTTALQSNIRFLLMHGVADDNVHLQNSLVLIDKLDLANVDNYDVQIFPDSDHGIYFHNANAMVYGRESSAFLFIILFLKKESNCHVTLPAAWFRENIWQDANPILT
jgi:dipeptidyl aminopeptidase